PESLPNLVEALEVRKRSHRIAEREVDETEDRAIHDWKEAVADRLADLQPLGGERARVFDLAVVGRDEAAGIEQGSKALPSALPGCRQALIRIRAGARKVARPTLELRQMKRDPAERHEVPVGQSLFALRRQQLSPLVEPVEHQARDPESGRRAEI